MDFIDMVESCREVNVMEDVSVGFVIRRIFICDVKVYWDC